MYYLFDRYEIENEGININDLLDNGIVKNFDEYYVSSSQEKISYNGKEIENFQDLNLFISGFDGGESVQIDGIQITMETVLDYLVEMIMTEQDEERIINSDNPKKIIDELTEKAKEVTISLKKEELIEEFDLALKNQKSGLLQWR